MNLPKYRLEFILNTYNAEATLIKNALLEFGDELEIGSSDDSQHNFKIRMRTEDPTMVFDICAQFGRIKSMKVNEGG